MKSHKLLLTIAFCIVQYFGNSQIITTIAGNGVGGDATNGVPALGPTLYNPEAVVVDDSGNVYIGNLGYNNIKKVDLNGKIFTIAGLTNAGNSGNGGPATLASFHSPSSLVLGKRKNMFVLDRDNNYIRRIDSFGIVRRFAGTGSYGFSGDGGAAVNATFNFIVAIAGDELGNLFIADDGNHRIRKVDTFGIVTTIAGTGDTSFNGGNIPALATNINEPFSLAVDKHNNIFYCDRHHRLYKIDTFGIVHIIAGNGIKMYSGDGGPATAASIMAYASGGLFVDGSDNIFFSDGLTRIRKIDTSGIITTFAGNGMYGYSGDGMLASSASIFAEGLTVDKLGNVYIADTYNYRIRKVTPGILPLTLISFSAVKENKAVHLTWQTANEVNFGSFNLEHSINGSAFKELVREIAGSGANHKYSYVHQTPNNGINYYRLKMIDKDGQFTYSPIRLLTTNNSPLTISIYPNPAKDNLQVQIDSDRKTALQLLVLSQDGKVVLSNSITATEGSILRSINISALAKGSYFLKATSTNNEECTIKFEKL